MWKKLIMIGFVIIMFIVFVCMGVSGIKQKQKYNECDSETIGYLERTESYRKSERSGNTTHTVTRYKGYYYTEINGIMYPINGSKSGYRSSSSVPETVDVVYKEDDPSECYIKGQNGTSDIILSIFGCILCFILNLLVLFGKANNRRIMVHSRR